MRGRPQYLAALRDRSDNPVFAAASRAPGLLAIAPGIEWAQLRTRHAIATDPNALDMLPYAPEGGPALARILARVYGIDFFAPAPEYRATAVVPVAPVQETWQKRGPDEWAAVAADFGISHVLAPARWALSLPVEEGGPGLRLYRLPSPPGEGPSGSQ